MILCLGIFDGYGASFLRRFYGGTADRDRIGSLAGGDGHGQIATLTGMDPQNFARLFKRETGMTPLEYRSFRDTTKKRRFYHVLPD